MKLLELYDGPLFDCQMIINILENNGIKSFLKDETTGTLNPVWRSGFGVKVIVSDSDYDKAKLIVNEYEKSQLNDTTSS